MLACIDRAVWLLSYDPIFCSPGTFISYHNIKHWHSRRRNICSSTTSTVFIFLNKDKTHQGYDYVACKKKLHSQKIEPIKAQWECQKLLAFTVLIICIHESWEYWGFLKKVTNVFKEGWGFLLWPQTMQIANDKSKDKKKEKDDNDN